LTIKRPFCRRRAAVTNIAALTKQKPEAASIPAAILKLISGRAAFRQRATSLRRFELTSMISSLDAHRYLHAKMTACSWQAGWRSLLIRAYEDAPHAEEFVTPPTRDHLIVLVTSGSCDIEARYRKTW
jgi:hypothetical protein